MRVDENRDLGIARFLEEYDIPPDFEIMPFSALCAPNSGNTFALRQQPTCTRWGDRVYALDRSASVQALTPDELREIHLHGGPTASP